MNPKNLFFILNLLPIVVFSQTATMSTTGDWDDATKWASSNIGNTISENVVLSGNTNPTIRNGFAYTIGNFSASGDNTLTIDATSSLTLGASGNSKNLTMTGNPKITVSGTLIIWGNASFNDKVEWDIRGTVIIKGNLLLNGGTRLDVKNGASLVVEGNFIAGNNTDVKVNGSGGAIQVYQNVNVGSGNLNVSSGTFQYGGTCTSVNIHFCGSASYNGALPIKLIYFKANQTPEYIKLFWATATEINFDKFIIEHSANGQDFQVIGEQKGAGNSLLKKDYSFTHNNPLIGKNYYRLKFIDFDQTQEYSPVVYSTFEGGKQISLFPNPVTGDSISILLNFDFKKGDKIEIFDNLGLKMQEENVYSIFQNLDVKNLSPGTYLLRYVGESYAKVIRFTVN